MRVLKDRDGPDLELEPGVTTGDYLDGFWQGTRQALLEKGRNSATITLTSSTSRGICSSTPRQPGPGGERDKVRVIREQGGGGW